MEASKQAQVNIVASAYIRNVRGLMPDNLALRGIKCSDTGNTLHNRVDDFMNSKINAWFTVTPHGKKIKNACESVEASDVLKYIRIQVLTLQ